MSSPKVDSHDRLECRNEQIKLRIKSLERKIPFLRPHQKWPTAKAIRYHQEHQCNSPASSESTPSPAGAQPKNQKANDGSSNPSTSHTKTNAAVLAASPVVTVASQPTARNPGEGSSIPRGHGKLKDTKPVLHKLADFPFPVSGCKKYTTFPQFSKLPAE